MNNLFLLLVLTMMQDIIYSAATIEEVQAEQRQQPLAQPNLQPDSDKQVQKELTSSIDNKKLERDLLAYAYNGNFSEIKKLIQLKVNINVTDEQGTTALMLASKASNKEIVKLLIEAGSDVNAVNDHGFTALMYPGNNQDIVDLLLSKSANINAPCTLGWTALIWASYKGQKNIVKQLLSAGADLKVTNQEGKNAIDFARQENPFDKSEITRKNKAEIAQLLRDEPKRRACKVKERQEALKKLLNEQLLPVLSQIIVMYAVGHFEDVPLSERKLS